MEFKRRRIARLWSPSGLEPRACELSRPGKVELCTRVTCPSLDAGSRSQKGPLVRPRGSSARRQQARIGQFSERGSRRIRPLDQGRTDGVSAYPEKQSDFIES